MAAKCCRRVDSLAFWPICMACRSPHRADTIHPQMTTKSTAANPARPANSIACGRCWRRQCWRPRRREAEVGTGADRVLIQWGVIDEAAYLRRLSHHLRISFEPHFYVPRADIFLPDTQLHYALHYAAQQGLLPFRRGGTLMLAISPRGLAARRLCHRFNEGGDFSDRICLVPTTQFNELLIARAGAALAHAATDGLGDRFATMTAAPARVTQPRWRAYAPYIAAVLAPTISVALWPQLTLGAASGLLAA